MFHRLSLFRPLFLSDALLRELAQKYAVWLGTARMCANLLARYHDAHVLAAMVYALSTGLCARTIPNSSYNVPIRLPI